MLGRFLFSPSGRAHFRRMTAVVIGCVGLALGGSFLLAITPAITDPRLQSVWVLFAVFILKFPLMFFLWWLIWRNKEWPMRPPRWSDEEAREIMTYLVHEADRSRRLPDAPARLRYLSGEAWHVADRVDGELKVDAVDVALHIDQVATSVGARDLHDRG